MLISGCSIAEPLPLCSSSSALTVRVSGEDNQLVVLLPPQVDTVYLEVVSGFTSQKLSPQ